MSEGDRLVRLPLLEGLVVVNKDNEVLVGTLEVDSDLGSLAARHYCCI